LDGVTTMSATDRLCLECNRPVCFRGLCRTHYRRLSGIRQRDGLNWDDLVAAGRCLAHAKPQRAAKGGVCLHCGIRYDWLRARRLCWKCYLDPEIRDSHARDRKLAPSAAAHRGNGATEPPPADEAPGTPDFLEVLAARAKAGYPLFRRDERIDVPRYSAVKRMGRRWERVGRVVVARVE
jgi:hypothetical protein